MDYKKRIKELKNLNFEEYLGKEIFRMQNRNMTHAEYIYLKQEKNCNTLKELFSQKARLTQKKILESYSTQYRVNGLSEKDFFPEDADIVVEQLLRFIDIPQHNHQFFEFVYVATGECIHKIADHSFCQTAGSFAVIPPTTPHVLYPTEDCLCITIKIRFKTFYEMELPDFVHFVYPMVFSCPDDIYIRNTILDMYQQQEEKKHYHKQLTACLFQSLILYVLQQYENQVQLMTSNSTQDFRIIEILNYAVNHYNTVTLHEVASHFHYNDSYFSDMFHRQTGTTFTTALRAFRLKKAAQLLQETKLTVAEICNEVGYKDVTQFIRNFKKLYQTTPAQYRKMTAEN